MSSVNVRIGDVVEFRIFEGKPYGIADVDRTVSIAIGELRDLKPLPKAKPYHYDCAEMIWIPPAKKWVIFVHESYQERSTGPNEEDCEGPYLAPPFGPPSAFDSGADNNEVVSRTISPYVGDELSFPRAVCRNCGKDGRCQHLGEVRCRGENVWDRYSFECLSCGHKEEKEEFAGKTMGGEDPCTICPYCYISNR